MESSDNDKYNSRLYVFTFTGLTLLTLLSVWFSQIRLSQFIIVATIMVIATIQAAIVFFYNMHLKFHEKILVVFASGVFGLLLVLIFGTLFDYIYR